MEKISSWVQNYFTKRESKKQCSHDKLRIRNLDTNKVKRKELCGKYYGLCHKVIDGDTIKVIFYERIGDNEPTMVPCRLAHLDTPEIKGATCDEEREEGLRCKEALSEMILNKFIVIDFLPKRDKYGRGLIEIWTKGKQSTGKINVAGYKIPVTVDCENMIDFDDHINVNNYILQNFMCSSYEGGKKVSFKCMKKLYEENRKM